MASGRVVRVSEAAATESPPRPCAQGIRDIQAELGVTPEFPAEVDDGRGPGRGRRRGCRSSTAPTSRSSPSTRRLRATSTRRCTSSATGDGYVVHYAIADVAAFVTPGDPVDAEANRRGETLYGADSKVPLHPTVLSEGAASLLPDQVRPALLWTIRLDATGEGTDVTGGARAGPVARNSSTTTAVQAAIDAGTADEPLQLLKEVGELRLRREAARGGVSLPLPEQEIDDRRRRLAPGVPVAAPGGGVERPDLAAHRLRRRLPDGRRPGRPAPHPAAARPARRTAPAAHRRRARASTGPTGWRTPTSSARSTRRSPSTRRWWWPAPACCGGAGTPASTASCPSRPRHSALAAEYAHVTAPLRRLGDRYAGEICLAICAGDRRTGLGARQQLPDLPKTLRESGTRSGRYQRAVVDLVEAGVLHHRVGETFDAVVVDVAEKAAAAAAWSPSRRTASRPRSSSTDPLPLGDAVSVRLTTADVERRKVEFTLER